MHRYFRNNAYGGVGGFYEAFFQAAGEEEYAERIRHDLSGFDAAEYLRDFPFYSEDDRRFRFLRDEVLSEEQYSRIIDAMIRKADVDPRAVASTLWMQPEHVRDLEDRGHVVGLHSHSHPMRIELMSYEEQRGEYETNSAILSRILRTRPVSMSHPANSRSATTFRVLRELGVEIGFRAVIGGECSQNNLDLPREDCVNILGRAGV